MFDQVQQFYGAIFVSGAILVVGFAMFIRSHLNLRSEYASLTLRVKKIDVDREETETRISAKWQELIQLTFTQQAEDIRRHRDAIDDLRTELGIQKTLNEMKEKTIQDFTSNQRVNIEKITQLEQQVNLLKLAEIERDKLKKEVADLTQLVEDNERKSKERHDQMNKVTEANFELDANLKRIKTERDHLLQQLEDCQSKIDTATAKIISEYFVMQQNPAKYFAEPDRYFSEVSVVQLLP